MSATDDVARMLTLVPWLLERPGASLTETADAFGVSPEQIRRDLVDHLDFCGLPGLGGGDLFDVSIDGDRIVVHMADELRRPLRPTAAEALRLVLTVDAVAEVLDDELPELRSAVGKIREALGISERVADVLEPTGGDLAVAARQALASGRRVLLSYRGRGDDAPRDRMVDPWAVRVVRSTWYLQGYDHDARDLRTFRLDRCESVTITDADAEEPAPAQLPVPRYQATDADISVTLAVTRRARWLGDVIDIEEVTEAADGGAELTFTTDVPGHVARLVLMAAGEARVVRPPEIAAIVAELAGAAAARYAPLGRSED